MEEGDKDMGGGRRNWRRLEGEMEGGEERWRREKEGNRGAWLSFHAISLEEEASGYM